MSDTPRTDDCEESYLRQTGEAINQDAIWVLARKLERKLSALTTDRRGEGIPESRSSSPESARPEPASAAAPMPDNVRDARARQAAGKGLPGDADVAHWTADETAPAPSKLPLNADTINYYRVHAINSVEEAICDQALAAIELEQRVAKQSAEIAKKESDRQYHMNAINRLAKFLAFHATSNEVIDNAMDNMKRLIMEREKAERELAELKVRIK